MDTLDYNHQSCFKNIPQRKIDVIVDELKTTHTDDKGVLSTNGMILVQAVTRYAYANIPTDYWFKDMHSFMGDRSLIRAYEDMTRNVGDSYKNGKSYCFAGSHGRGKTMTSCCILKRAVETGEYSALYVNLIDVINAELSENKIRARRELSQTDFLVIDEFDPRFMGTENAADLFGRILEPTIRTRIQNQLPTIVCTNTANPAESFQGQLQMSFKSLMNKISVVSVLGKDFRKQE